MALFRRRGDELESRLRALRRDPRDEFVEGIVSRVTVHEKQYKTRLALGVVVAAVGLAMFGAFGGLSYASSASRSVVNVVAPSVGSSGSTVEMAQSLTAANAQYVGKTSICHAPPRGGYILITVNISALLSHKAHGDTLPGSGGTCPGPPISS